jgi:hypothetical protein
MISYDYSIFLHDLGKRDASVYPELFEGRAAV